MATDAPCEAKPSAIAQPMLREPPVTSAVLPSSEFCVLISVTSLCSVPTCRDSRPVPPPACVVRAGRRLVCRPDGPGDRSAQPARIPVTL
jgi:hypothetical protein